MDVYPLIENAKTNHKISYYKYNTDDDIYYLVKCSCGFEEKTSDSEEIQILGTRHRDLYILSK